MLLCLSQVLENRYLKYFIKRGTSLRQGNSLKIVFLQVFFSEHRLFGMLVLRHGDVGHGGPAEGILDHVNAGNTVPNRSKQVYSLKCFPKSSL